MLWGCIYAFFASLGFGIIFNIRGNKLLLASLGGALGWFSYSLSLHLGINNFSSLAIAGLSFSSYSEVMARVCKTPVTIFIICALIPLVPGGGMYYTMLEVIQGNLAKALETGVETIASAGSLVIGMLMVSSIMKLIKNYKQRYYGQE